MIYKIQGEQPFQVLASNFSIGPSNEGYTLQISSDGTNYSDLFSVGANVTRMVTGVANGSFYRLSGNASEVAVNWSKQCNDGGSGGGSGQQGPMGPEGAQGYQGAEGAQGPAGDPASGSGIPIVSSLRDAEAVAAPVGSFVGVYSDSARTLYQKVSGGTIGQWEGWYSDGQNTAFHLLYENLEDFLDFTNGKCLFSTKHRSQENYYNAVVDKANLKINLMTTDSADTVAYVEYLGAEATFKTPEGSATAQVKVKWEKDGIYFYNVGARFYLRNLLDLTTDGIYFKKIEDPLKANRQDLGFTGNTAGVPKWNNDGVIVGKDYDISVKGVWFNTNSTSSSQKANFMMSSNADKCPDRIYAPIAAGTQGQILTFAGNTTAPAWTDWIKSVSITQDAYDALVAAGTTDPNTLYLIVD